MVGQKKSLPPCERLPQEIFDLALVGKGNTEWFSQQLGSRQKAELLHGLIDRGDIQAFIDRQDSIGKAGKHTFEVVLPDFSFAFLLESWRVLLHTSCLSP